MIAKRCSLQSQFCVSTFAFPDATFDAVIAHPNPNCSNNIDLVATSTINLWFSKISTVTSSDVSNCCGSSAVGKHALLLINDQLKAVGIASTRFKKSTSYDVDYLVFVFSSGIKTGSPVYAAGPTKSECQTVDSIFTSLCKT